MLFRSTDICNRLPGKAPSRCLVGLQCLTLCDRLGLGFRVRSRHFYQTSISQLWLSGFGKGKKNLPTRSRDRQAVFGNCVLSASLKRTSRREGTSVMAAESRYFWQISLKDHRFSATKYMISYISECLLFPVKIKFSECEHFSESNCCSS